MNLAVFSKGGNDLLTDDLIPTMNERKSKDFSFIWQTQITCLFANFIGLITVSASSLLAKSILSPR